MKRVDAMIQPVSGTGTINAIPKADGLRRVVMALDKYLGGFDGEDGDRPKPEPSEIVRLTRAVKEQLDSFDDKLDDHDCSAAGQSLAPVGSNEPLDTLLRREGFNSADMIAIVKMDEAEDLAALRKAAGPKLKCCGRYAVEHNEDERWIGYGDEAYAEAMLWCPDALEGIDVPKEYEQWADQR